MEYQQARYHPYGPMASGGQGSTPLVSTVSRQGITEIRVTDKRDDSEILQKLLDIIEKLRLVRRRAYTLFFA